MARRFVDVPTWNLVLGMHVNVTATTVMSESTILWVTFASSFRFFPIDNGRVAQPRILYPGELATRKHALTFQVPENLRVIRYSGTDHKVSLARGSVGVSTGDRMLKMDGTQDGFTLSHPRCARGHLPWILVRVQSLHFSSSLLISQRNLQAKSGQREDTGMEL
ncbi:hypothetical protein GALMADRAFT_216587 [Galerina marginata CBS 339.88]|uniref:Uncharacterized protein n=1 Tax=Galerina marginata (strain CBS 339.88) TaxID=685588 RepID=A0A067SBI0_GALM3|nr:hypothetical protein GALMADRAFT_216587 [Galerina marginata CBS 339.88]